jgi:(2R)-3-sulfolactate dehydrogenase (NADP+)
MIALSPEALGGPSVTEHVAKLAAAVAAEPGTRLPGMRRYELRRQAAARGLAVPKALIAEIAALGKP